MTVAGDGEGDRDAERRARKLETSRAWRAANKERAAETQRAWYAANKERKAEYERAWYAANKERRAETQRAWDAANKERKAETQRAWYAANKERRAAQVRRCQLSKYGLTVETYAARLQAQGGVDPINGLPPNGRPLCVDHDDKLGKRAVRGLLQHKSNAGLGHFDHRADWLLNAVEYLVSFEYRAYPDGGLRLRAAIGLVSDLLDRLKNLEALAPTEPDGRAVVGS